MIVYFLSINFRLYPTIINGVNSFYTFPLPNRPIFLSMPHSHSQFGQEKRLCAGTVHSAQQLTHGRKLFTNKAQQVFQRPSMIKRQRLLVRNGEIVHPIGLHAHLTGNQILTCIIADHHT